MKQEERGTAMTRLQIKRSLAIVTVLFALLALFYASCTSSDEPEQADVEVSEISSFDGTAYLGEESMPELILGSQVIARVRFNSVSQTTELLRYGSQTSNPTELYAGALVITFDVMEYLKGSGGTQVRGVLVDGDSRRWTEAEARAAAGDLLAFREKKYDGRDAIVFLSKGPVVPRTQQVSDLYYLSLLRANGELAYTVDSRWAKAWLPAAAPPSTRGRSAGASGNAQLFLTNAPDSTNGVSSGGVSVRGTSGQSNGQAESMTLGELKTFIADLEAQVTAGGGTEDYRRCLIWKYDWLSRVEVLQASRAKANLPWVWQSQQSLASGSPAGSEVYEGGDGLILDAASKDTEPTWSDVAVLKSGQDAALFNHTWPLKATTTRPLPAGEYRFYWAEQSQLTALCDAMPEVVKTQDEIVVTVTPPPNTLHEAFFDPVALTSGVGADSSNGVLKPTSFSVDGTSTFITSLKWDNGSVVLTLSPHASLPNHKLDFIELDGSISLSLQTSSATEDTTAGTLTWTVTDQSWHDGDTLMLRIAASTTPEPTPVPTIIPTSVSTSPVSITLSPSQDTNPTRTIITVAWNDSHSCVGSYFVWIENSSAYMVGRLGFHPAPATTSITSNLGINWDNVPNFDWTILVRCDPSNATLDTRVIGQASLQSGLP